MSSFAENLKKIRLEKGFSQEVLSKKIGVHVTHISRYERGLSIPSIEIVKKISELFELSIDNLVYGDNNQIMNNSIKDRDLLNLFGKVQILNNKQKETIKDLMSAFILKSELQQKLA